MRKLATPILAITLALGLTACSNDKEVPAAEETATTVPAETQTETEPEDTEPVAAISEAEALEGLATGLSSEATVEQWRSISKGVCETLQASEKPLDEEGETSIRAADTLMSGPMIVGTGDTKAQVPTEDLSGVQLALLILNSTQISCPEYQHDAAAAAETIAANY